MESISSDLELIVDMGEVGYRQQHRFVVSLDANALVTLFEQAREGHRIYELMAIERPGDIWPYVWVIPVHTPPRVAARVEALRQVDSRRYASSKSWPEGRVPFLEFDRLFVLMDDDTEPEDEAWRRHRDADEMKRFASRVFDRVQEVQRGLEPGDAVMRHELGRIRSRNHAYDFLDRQAALDATRWLSMPGKPLHPETFYAKLAALLADPQLTSVAYRSGRDLRILRMLCNEQRMRADKFGCEAGQALRLSAVGNLQIDNEAWGSELWMYDEGLGYGDLFIDEEDEGNCPVRELHGSPYRSFGRTILTRQDEGDLAGYEKESGEGWVLYRRRLTPNLDDRYRQPKSELEVQARRALELLRRADAIVVAAGAGMGVDSGLPDFRGRDGFWNAYPALGRAHIDFMQIASPRAFREMPERAWGFYGHRLALYRRTNPHLGFKILKKWSGQESKALTIFTSNVDGQFQAAGFGDDQIVECHGSVHWLQCLDACSADIWSADDFQPEIDPVEGVLLNAAPRCRHCGGLARPNVLMFDDEGWIPVRRRDQGARQADWLAGTKRPVVIEIGAGVAIPSVRNFTDRVLQLHGGTLVRINPDDASVARDLDVSLPMRGLEALLAIEAQRMFVR